MRSTQKRSADRGQPEPAAGNRSELGYETGYAPDPPIEISNRMAIPTRSLNRNSIPRPGD